jgi:hypothetical protein
MVGRKQVFEQFSQVKWSMASVKYKFAGLQCSYLLNDGLVLAFYTLMVHRNTYTHTHTHTHKI